MENNKQSKIFVTMTDKHMSGWGMADGKINKLIFECDSWEEAEIVEQNAINQGSMKYINTSRKKPYYSPSRYYVQTKTKEDYESWYKRNHFRK
ncbi:hypothetical protein BSK59_15630 [Paenibacillus odorifer]|uniref:hypothetical protein n=1 Tax=Paenibacillus odorifer TaxID=189426 RepID=UPI00096DAA2D|nr:hypothetical protein [Paenibacillus odorifer]OME54010.1 hypothetical protein BSK59_15630 [Paenibacillus odorifer]